MRVHRSSEFSNEGGEEGGLTKRGGVSIILDLVRREGVAKGKEVPSRLPLGTDCYESIKGKCEDTLRILDEWKDIIHRTDYARP